MAIEFNNVPCQSVEDKEIFFPDSTDVISIKKAKKICSKCTMTKECLSFAFATSSVGIWAGTTHEERKLIKRRATRNVKK